MVRLIDADELLHRLSDASDIWCTDDVLREVKASPTLASGSGNMTDPRDIPPRTYDVYPSPQLSEVDVERIALAVVALLAKREMLRP